ncbi:hypothetical protein DASC09_013570 [Saccharomycopsis crataegensis]|uniref:Uncharacterized protein n=1 Tax=Saccharomycopsis crataegensis TaxID=43959 RepID=A0AAV5QGW8_9ASCO|nr:hypothetical protein DASC09_013570 [Saccharomycopsis crataegensis]
MKVSSQSLIGGYSSDSSSSSDFETQRAQEKGEQEETLSVKRRKLHELKSLKEKKENYQRATNEASKATKANDASGIRNPISISSFLPPPKNNNKRPLIENDDDNNSEKKNLGASLSYKTRTLGGAIKNQFNGVSVRDKETEYFTDDELDEMPESEIKSSVNVTSFLPNSLLRKKKSKKQYSPPITTKSGSKSNFSIDSHSIFPSNHPSVSTPREKSSSLNYASLESIPKPPILDPITSAPGNEPISNENSMKLKIPENSNVLEFNMDDFYKENNELISKGAVPTAIKDVKTYNANSKNQLSSLIKFTNDEDNSIALQEKFKKEKNNQRKIREKYGW